MRRSLIRVLLLGFACGFVLTGVHSTQASPSDARAAVQTLVRSVEARRGVQHRSLVVVALVARDAGDDTGPAASTDGLAWRAAADGRIHVDAADGAGDRVLATGTLLREGPRELVLAHPAWLRAGGECEVEAVRVPCGLGVAEEAARSFAGLAGPEARHVVTIAPHPDALGELLTLERLLAGLPDGDVAGALAAVRAAPRITDIRAQGAKAIARLATAYGGETRGYVAFLGHRPVEVVLAGTSAIHAGLIRDGAAGLATYLALWEEQYGRTDEAIDAVAWPRALEVAARVLDDVSKAGVRHVDPDTLWRLRTNRVSRLGWLLLDDDRPVLLEAWPLGDGGPFPVPAREPGGKPLDERPDSIMSGAMTREFLRRFSERLGRIRRGLGLR